MTRAHLRSLAVLAVAALAAGCGSEHHKATKKPETSVLFTQLATGGSLKTAADGGKVLTLRGVPAQVVWFQDRPGRRAGQLPASGLARGWAGLGFAKDAPNAALTLVDGPEEADTFVVELVGRPRYDPARATMRYQVRVLSDAPDRLAEFHPDGTRVPHSFGASSLFIDTATARQQSARHLGGGRWRVDLG